MDNKYDFPYPTPFEAIRVIVNALDLKHSNKYLDERAFTRVYDPRELKEALTNCIYRPIEKYIGLQPNNFLTDLIEIAFDKYIQMTGTVSACGLSRAEMTPILLQGLVKGGLKHLVQSIYLNFEGPHPSTLFSSDTSAVTTSLNWISSNEKGWSCYLSNLEKEQKDRISAWLKGIDLPASQSILLLQENYSGPRPEQIDWQRVRILLFSARAIDWLKKEDSFGLVIDEIRLSFWGVKSNFDMVKKIATLQSAALGSINSLKSSLSTLQQGLRRTVAKESPKKYLELLNSVRAELSSTSQYGPNKYWLDWHEARWNVFSGNLIHANYLYKAAFEDALFRSGENQKDIIEEALVVASNLEVPDKVFLKHLKWSLIQFGYDIASVTTTQPSNKFSDNIEDWEINLWKAGLKSKFPLVGLFPGVELNATTPKIGPLVLTDLASVKPDYRNPNRQIKIGDTWKKTTPQLVWFIETENYEVCKKLLAKGTCINVSSESGDTPILMALEALNVTELPYRSLDDRFFWLISSYSHLPNIINGRTQKKRLLPIISAVQTGRFDIIQKIIELGADPNGRGQTGEQTALNLCLKYINTLKDVSRARLAQEAMQTTDEVLDSIRRHSMGMTGISLKEQALHLAKFNNTERIGMRYMRITEKMNLITMREIAKYLIISGADVNAEHTSPVKGYTPLMLAAEFDEYELFNLMLVHGGNPKKAYTDIRSNRKVSCFEIADSFNSRNVGRILSDIAPYLSAH
jgi:ankyrin repeat protein